MDALASPRRTVQSVVRKVIACGPGAADPAGCGLGRGPITADLFDTCRAYFVSGLEGVRSRGDERTLPAIVDSVRSFMAGEGASDAVLDQNAALLTGGRGEVVMTVRYADMKMPPLPAKGETGPLDRTMKRGWRRHLWTVALLHRCALRKRRETERALKDSRTALALVACAVLPDDVVGKIVELVRT
jgi:hypothetical protein